MANPTKVLTYDGLLYYTLLIKNKLASVVPSTITIVKSSSNITFALTSTEGTGTATTLPAVDSTYAGLMTPTMLSKLDNIAAGAQVNVIEHIEIPDPTEISGDTIDLIPSNKYITIPAVSNETGSETYGLMSPSDKEHLDELYEDAADYAYLSDIGVVTASTSSASPAKNDYWKDSNLLKIYNGTSWVTVSSLKIVRLIGSGNSTEGIYLYIPNTGFTELGTSSDVASKVADVTVNGTSIVNNSTKVAALTVDTTATNGSTNPITSDAVYDINIALTNNINRLDNRVLTLDYVSSTTPSSPSYGEFWYDTANDILKEYRQGAEGSSDAWVSYISSTNSFVIGTFTDIRTDETKGYIFTYNGNVIKIADNTDVTTALALKAPLASPALTGTPTAPTATTGTSSTQIATTAFVQQELSAAVLGRFKFVNSLPVTGESGYIYLVPHQHTLTGTTVGDVYTPDTSSDIKDEYIWDATNSRYELIGHTDIDLSNYWNKTDLVELTTTEITTIWNTGMSNE